MELIEVYVIYKAGSGWETIVLNYIVLYKCGQQSLGCKVKSLSFDAKV